MLCIFHLTYFSQMEFLIIRTSSSPFPVLWVSGCMFLLYSNLNRMLCKQIVESLIRRHRTRVCTVCLCPTKRTLGLNVLICANFEISKLSKDVNARAYSSDMVLCSGLFEQYRSVCCANILGYKRIIKLS